jgi:hypothetical protein
MCDNSVYTLSFYLNRFKTRAKRNGGADYTNKVMQIKIEITTSNQMNVSARLMQKMTRSQWEAERDWERKYINSGKLKACTILEVSVSGDGRL